MASETVGEKKPEEEASLEEKEEPKGEEDNKQVPGKEVIEQESRDVHEKEVSGDTKEETEDKESVEQRVEESKEEEAEKSEKQKRGRKKSLKTDSRETKDASTEKKQKLDHKSGEKKEPITPASERPTRERKIVERYSAPTLGRSSSSKGLSIETGRGTQLKDIPNVAFKLSKRKPDENLQILHTILFGKKAKAQVLKRNIGQFSGYVWVVDEQEKQKAKVREKLDKCVKEKLMDFCDVLNIPINKSNVKKEELSVKLLEFLEAPHTTTDVLIADKEQKGKKRKKATSSKSASRGATSDTSAKKQRKSSGVGEKQNPSSEVEEDEDDDKDAKDGSEDENEDTTAPEQGDHEETKSEEDDGESEEQTSGKKNSKNVKEGSAKSMDKVVPDKKSSPAKPEEGSKKSSKKASSSSSKKGDTEIDRSFGSLSKSKGSTSKKPKGEGENAKDQGVTTEGMNTRKRRSGKSPPKVSTKDQGVWIFVALLFVFF